jgi:hypothetical protein
MRRDLLCLAEAEKVACPEHKQIFLWLDYRISVTNETLRVGMANEIFGEHFSVPALPRTEESCEQVRSCRTQNRANFV